MDEQPAQDRTGTTIGGFRVVKQLGAGGMGTVYQAEDSGLNRFVALKLLSPALAADKRFVERFLREARSIAALRHPNLMHIYTVGEDGGVHFFAMEYVEGQTLGDILRRRKGPLSLPAAVRVLEQVMDALHKVHEAGIVHRDLKPGNIMIDNDQRAIVVDFGLSKDVSDEGLTQSGMILGTPDYMSPEQIEAAAVGPGTDIYALGIILYEMLTKTVPFHSRSAIMTMRAHCENPVPSVTGIRTDLSPQLDKLLQKMMAKRPEERYANIPDLAKDLCDILATPTLKRLGSLSAAPAGVTIKAAAPAKSSRSSARTTARSLGVSASAVTEKERRTIPGAMSAKSKKKEDKSLVVIAAAAGGAGALLLLLVVMMLKGASSPETEPQPDTKPTTPAPMAVAALTTANQNLPKTVVPEEPMPTFTPPTPAPVTMQPAPVEAKTPEPHAPAIEPTLPEAAPSANQLKTDAEEVVMNHEHIGPDGLKRNIRLIRESEGLFRLEVAVETKEPFTAMIRRDPEAGLVLQDPDSLTQEQRQIAVNLTHLANRRMGITPRPLLRNREDRPRLRRDNPQP